MDASADRLLAALRPYLAYVTAPLGVYALYKLLCKWEATAREAEAA